MEQVSYKQRILSLIKLNKTDIEIKSIIKDEYNKVFKISDIEYLRNTFFVDSDNQKSDNDNKINFVLDLLKGNPSKTYTKKQIVDLVKIKHEIKLSKIEIKDILWSKLRAKIIYDSDNWTYKLKDENNQSVSSIKQQTLNNNTKGVNLEGFSINDYTYSIIIDGYTIEIITVVNEFGPLYWFETEGLKQTIYYNKIHPKAFLFQGSNLFPLLIALGRTSLSFSDNTGEIFFNRLKNYIDLT